MMLLAALLFQVGASFSPPPGASLRVETEMRDGDTRRYRLERLVRFTREGPGWQAEVILLRAEGDARDASAGMFQAGFAAFSGQPIRFHLDAEGHVTEVEARSLLWERFCSRVAQFAAERRSLAPKDRSRLAERIAAPLRALPAERQRGILASLVEAIIERDVPGAGSETVHLPGASPFGGTATLDGTRSVTRAADGAQIVHTLASAEVPAPGGSGNAQLTLEREVRSDPATGLIEHSTSTTRTLVSGVPSVRIVTIIVHRSD